MSRALLLAAALSAGCTSRVTLPAAPEAAAPIAARRAFYRRYRPAPVGFVVVDPLRPASVAFARMGPFALADGTEIDDPRDLAAMIGDDTPVATNAAHAARVGTLADGLFWGGVGVGLAGIVVIAAPPWREPDTGAPTSLWVGLGAGLASAVLLGIAQAWLRPVARAHREAAFEGLDAALRRRMNLCGGEVPDDCAAAFDAPRTAPGVAPP